MAKLVRAAGDKSCFANLDGDADSRDNDDDECETMGSDTMRRDIELGDSACRRDSNDDEGDPGTKGRWRTLTGAEGVRMRSVRVIAGSAGLASRELTNSN